MSRVWSKEERESCRAAVRQDNPLLPDDAIEVVTDVWLKFTEDMEDRLLYGSGGAYCPVGIFGYTEK